MIVNKYIALRLLYVKKYNPFNKKKTFLRRWKHITG